MSEVDEAMLQRMIHIVNEERKPFSYFDFLDMMKPKTYRNKISQLKKEGIVETDIRSPIAFHTLKGHKFGRPGTLDPPVVSSSHPLYKTLQYMPFDKQSIHDIHSTFKSTNIWQTFAKSKFNFPRIQTSEQIVIPSWRKGNTIVRIVISKTDTVSVTIGCSLDPIPLDFEGIIRFFCLLAETRGLLVGLTLNYNQTTCSDSSLLSPTAVNLKVVPIKIPDYLSWFITMWHFGRDALVEHNGKELSITTENAQHIITRVYSKEWDNGTGRRKTRRIRKETQEYPNTTVEDAIAEKLGEQEQEAS